MKIPLQGHFFLQKFITFGSLQLILPGGIPSQPLIFKIIGESALPQIAFISPEATVDASTLEIKFSMCLMDVKFEKQLQLKNVGELETKIILELVDNENGYFNVNPDKSTESMLKVSEIEPGTLETKRLHNYFHL